MIGRPTAERRRKKWTTSFSNGSRNGGASVMEPAHPKSLAAFCNLTAARVFMADVPATIGTRPLAVSTAISKIRQRSTSSSENHSPVHPATMMP